MRIMKGLKKEDLRILGIYLVVILALVRLVLLPLNNSLRAKKTMLDEYRETYRTKMMTEQKQGYADKERGRLEAGEKKLALSIYPKDSSAQAIQVEVLRMVLKTAEKNKVSVLSYEFPDPLQGKNLSEVSMQLKLSAAPAAMVKFLKELEGTKRLMDVTNFRADRNVNNLDAALTLSVYKSEGKK